MKKLIYSHPAVIALTEAIENRDADIKTLKAHVMRLTRHAHGLETQISILKGNPLAIDHINGDPTDNSMENLRIVRTGGNHG